MLYNHCSKHDTAIKNVGCVVTPQTKLKIGVGDSDIVAHLGTRTALECRSRNLANKFLLCPLFSLFDSPIGGIRGNLQAGAPRRADSPVLPVLLIT